MTRIAIFASGSGSNAENLIQTLGEKDNCTFPLIICDNKKAGIWQRAERLGIRCVYYARTELATSDAICQLLREEQIELILLAGFLGRITGPLLEQFSGRIVNLHPALLPKFGGKGMYGHHVHEAVIAAGETLSGITLHFIDEDYDRGTTICQATCPVYPEQDTPDTLAERIHRLEHLYFPTVVRDLVARIERGDC